MCRTPIRTAIIGAAGYSGGELARLLLVHPNVRIVGLFGSERRAGANGEGQPLADVHPRLRGAADLRIRPTSVQAVLDTTPDAVFLATPVETSLQLAPALITEGRAPVVFDLSAAFRLKDSTAFSRAYGVEHPSPRWAERAAYGLAELHREAIEAADLVAVAGCYPTAATLALAPLVRAGAMAPSRRPSVFAVSGVSGAGRSASERTSFCEVSLSAYSPLTHRHNPEIDAYVGMPTSFTPHLGAFDRGIVATMHVDLAPGWDGARVRGALERAYSCARFVRILPPGAWPSIGAVSHTNFCDIGIGEPDADGRIAVSSAIDNLVKGAAGQAVQCMNIRFALEEHAGLLAA